MAAEIETAVKIGETISIRGVRPRQADIIAAVALTAAVARRSSTTVRPRRRARASHSRGTPNRMDAEGTVRLSLFGPKGERRGALLEDGTVVRISPKEAASLAELLRPGARLQSAALVCKPSMVAVIAAEEIGPDRHA